MKIKLALLALIVTNSFSAQATLFDRGNGMIYDDVLNVTWLQDANNASTTGFVTASGRDVTATGGLMNWDESVEWATQLNHAGFNEWRLPHVKPINGTHFVYNVSYTGATDFGEHITSLQSEISYMYFVNLVNSSVHDSPSGCGPTASSSCLTNTGPFENLESYNYWTGTEIEYNDLFAWSFNSQHGIQTPYDGKPNQFYAWAVHDGDIAAVPLPAALWLFSISFLGLIKYRKR